jgi:hypothetical protein
MAGSFMVGGSVIRGMDADGVFVIGPGCMPGAGFLCGCAESFPPGLGGLLSVGTGVLVSGRLAPAPGGVMLLAEGIVFLSGSSVSIRSVNSVTLEGTAVSGRVRGLHPRLLMEAPGPDGVLRVDVMLPARGSCGCAEPGLHVRVSGVLVPAPGGGGYVSVDARECSWGVFL